MTAPTSASQKLFDPAIQMARIAMMPPTRAPIRRPFHVSHGGLPGGRLLSSSDLLTRSTWRRNVSIVRAQCHRRESKSRPLCAPVFELIPTHNGTYVRFDTTPLVSGAFQDRGRTKERPHDRFLPRSHTHLWVGLAYILGLWAGREELGEGGSISPPAMGFPADSSHP